MNPIEIQGLHVAFGARTVLRGLDLTLQPGTLCGLVGPNGSGKSTCLRSLIGLVPRSDGRIRTLGMDPGRDGLRIRRHSCYLPGETSIYHHLRGREFLRFALRFYPKLQDDLMAQLLGAFQLPMQKRVRNYSAGMKQKLALMATLIPDVELYILDEPDRALDATTRFLLRDVLRDLRNKGKSILLSSHHLQDVESLADQLTFLIDGTHIAEDRVQAAQTELRRRVRVQLQPGCALPPGAQVLHTEGNGAVCLLPDGSPADFVASIPPGELLAAEIGTVHLEDLYRLLTDEEAA